jgi:TPR repeat protein
MKLPLYAAILSCLLALGGTGPARAGAWDQGLAAYKKGDYAAALELWRPLAEQGNADAQFRLGLLYDRGTGVPQDYAEALRWFHKAADEGLPQAQYRIGYMYEHGEGVPQEPANALRWYLEAAEQGFAKAQLALGRLYETASRDLRDFPRAYMWLAIVARRKDAGPDAQAAARDMAGLAAKMSKAQLAEGRRLARQWRREQ